MLRNSSQLQDTWFANGGHAIMKTMWGWSQGISNYLSLKEQNDSLAVENLRLRTHLLSLEDYIKDSLTVAKMAHSSGADGFRYTPATICKISNNSQHNYLIINKGEVDGVSVGDGIITARGAIGIVDGVSANFAFVRSFKNHRMSISARLGETGVSGPMSWDGIHSNGAVIKGIPHHLETSPGDTIYTSGHSSIFPPDIPLGVTGESKVVNGSTLEIKVNLFEDFGALRYVTVVQNLYKEEIKALEGKE